MAKVASANISTAIDALKYAEDIAKESPSSLFHHADQLVIACCMQLRLVFTVHFDDEKITNVKHLNESIRLTKHLLNCLLNMFTKQPIADAVSVRSLQVCSKESPL